jgi:hypothetical protein
MYHLVLRFDLVKHVRHTILDIRHTHLVYNITLNPKKRSLSHSDLELTPILLTLNLFNYP